jgi:hypothetical protein
MRQPQNEDQDRKPNNLRMILTDQVNFRLEVK